ncbi:MAG: hypothetical protein GY898_21625 [Proteobacteria bacterium]|nr:hypothetical protein [Pseudomonadota bacterium]
MRISITRVETADPDELRQLAASLQLEVIRLRAAGRGGRTTARAAALERRAAELRILADDRRAVANATTVTDNGSSGHSRWGPDPSALLTLSEAARLLRMRRVDAVRAIRESGTIIRVEGRERVRWGMLQQALAARATTPPRPGRTRGARADSAGVVDPWERFLPKR